MSLLWFSWICMSLWSWVPKWSCWMCWYVGSSVAPCLIGSAPMTGRQDDTTRQTRQSLEPPGKHIVPVCKKYILISHNPNYKGDKLRKFSLIKKKYVQQEHWSTLLPFSKHSTTYRECSDIWRYSHLYL